MDKQSSDRMEKYFTLVQEALLPYQDDLAQFRQLWETNKHGAIGYFGEVVKKYQMKITDELKTIEEAVYWDVR